MPDQLQLRGGTTAEHSTFTGAIKEVTVDTSKKTVVVHDGTTAGGIALLRQDGSNSALALGSEGTPSLKWDANTGIYSPGADQVAVATNGTGRLFVDASGRVALGGTTVTDLNLLNIQGSTATDNVGVVLNKTNGTAQVWGIQNSGSLNFFNYTASSTALTINTSNQVGIGTSTPTNTSKLEIQTSSTTAPGLWVQTGGTTSAYPIVDVRNGANLDVFAIKGDGTSYFQGKLGIGATGPAKQLHVEGTSSDVTLRIGRNGYIQTDLIGSTGAGANDFKITQNGFDRFVIEYGGNSAARIDSSGRLLVGTTSSTGLLSNTAPVIAGLFQSFNDTGDFTTGVAQTLFTIPNADATYIITLRRSAVGNATNYEAVSILSTNATVGGSVSTVLTALKTAGNVSISISGTDLKGTQTSGGAASLQWVVTRVG